MPLPVIATFKSKPLFRKQGIGELCLGAQVVSWLQLHNLQHHVKNTFTPPRRRGQTVLSGIKGWSNSSSPRPVKLFWISMDAIHDRICQI